MDKSTPKLHRYICMCMSVKLRRYVHVQVPVSVSVCVCTCTFCLPFHLILWFVSGTPIFAVAYLNAGLGYKTRQ